MSPAIADLLGKSSRGIVIAQIAIALTGLSVLTLAPRDGEPVTLVPLDSRAAHELPQIISQPGTLLLGRGSIDGSYVLRGKRPGFLDALFDRHVLVLNASAPLCGPALRGRAI